MFSKIMGFVVAVCVGIGFVGCGKGSDALSCESSSLQKAFKKDKYTDKFRQKSKNVEFSDFKMFVSDGNDPNLGRSTDTIAFCECIVKMNGTSEELTFIAKRLENGKIEFSDFW